MQVQELVNRIENRKYNSAWSRGVKEYALELLEEWAWNHEGEEFIVCPATKKELLNGADSWLMYSEGGCSLIYNGDIAERLCTPSELKKCKGGEWNPSRTENWIECQARALYQAERLINRLAK